MENRLGYACINLSSSYSSNRGMIKRNFLKDKEDKVPYSKCSALALENVKDLMKIVQWNNANDVSVFRMSSSIFPWMSEYEFTDLPDHEEICSVLAEIGRIAKDKKQRLSFHPGPFNILASPHEGVVEKAIKELDQHSSIMDTMGLSADHMSKINIHVGGHYGDKASATSRWIDNFKRLSKNTRARLVVENDDKTGLYSVKDLHKYIHSKIEVPITFDFLHHDCHPDDLTEKEALELSLSTWDKSMTPCTHYSSSKKLFEDSTAKKLAHADYIHEKINTYDKTFDIVLEAKAKDLALLKYRNVKDTI